MRVYGIDVNVLTRKKRTGTERYVFELIQEMKKISLHIDEQVVLYSSAALPELNPLPDGWEVKVLKWPFPFRGWTHVRLSLELFFRTPNLFFTPAHEIPFLTGKAKIVSTVHDVAFHFFPELYSDKAKKRQEWSLARSIKKSAKMIAISHATKSDLERKYAVNPDRISVVQLGIDAEDFNTNAVTSSNPYFLHVGRVEKKKNIQLLVQAFDAFKQSTKSKIGLVLVGSFGYGSDEINEQIKISEFADDIKVMGYMSDKDMIPLLNGALAYVLPSKFEGFGMPALEAMAAGVPLIASDLPVMREVAEGAALFSDPDDVNSWTTSMTRMATDQELRSTLIAAGHERAKKFSWAKTAERTWKVLRNV